MKIYINDLVKGHSDVKVKCLTFGLYTQVSNSGPLGPLVYFSTNRNCLFSSYFIGRDIFTCLKASNVVCTIFTCKFGYHLIICPIRTDFSPSILFSMIF